MDTEISIIDPLEELKIGNIYCEDCGNRLFIIRDTLGERSTDTTIYRDIVFKCITCDRYGTKSVKIDIPEQLNFLSLLFDDEISKREPATF